LPHFEVKNRTRLDFKTLKTDATSGKEQFESADGDSPPASQSPVTLKPTPV